jgi:glycosyltransferase involved in cell wall biosynthesis
MGSRSITISIIVPVYNSARTLPEVIQRIDQGTREFSTNRELILVNDGSSDASWAAIVSLVEANTWLLGIDLMRNYGQHNALLAGIRAATNEVIITLDDDLQYQPEDIGLLIERLCENYDVVYGVAKEVRHGPLRNFSTWLTKIVLRSILKIEIVSRISPFRAFWTPLREGFAGYHGSRLTIDALLSWSASRYSSVQVRHHQRMSGHSNYTFRKLMTYLFMVVVGFTTLPLYFSLIMGSVLALGGTGLLAVALISSTTPPVSTMLIIASIFVAVGLQLISAGILGVYLSQIHLNTTGRPSYVIRTQMVHSPADPHE